MSEDITRKIWGKKHRLLENDLCEIDLLTLEKNTACSQHYHLKKINRFILLKGDVRIKTDLGEHKLKIEEPFDIQPNLQHQFIAKRNSILLEIAFVNEGKIDINDIKRLVQGGKFIKGKFYTLEQLREKNWE